MCAKGTNACQAWTYADLYIMFGFEWTYADLLAFAHLNYIKSVRVTLNGYDSDKSGHVGLCPTKGVNRTSLLKYDNRHKTDISDYAADKTDMSEICSRL